MFCAAVAFAGGELTASSIRRPTLWWLVASLLAAGFALVMLGRARKQPTPWRERMAYSLALAAVFSVGAWVREVSGTGNPSLADIHQFTEIPEGVTVTAHVTHDGILHGIGRMRRQSVDVETEDINGIPVRVGLRVALYGGDPLRDEQDDEENPGALPPVLTYGQRLRFPAKLHEPRNFNNPGAQDFRGYLLHQGIAAQASVRGDRIEVLPGFSGTRWGRWRSKAYRGLLSHIHALWPPEEAALLDAILIGEKSFISRQVRTTWSRTGIYHILVVSGMNVTIFAAVLFWTFRRMRAGNLLATILTLLISVAYAYLAESGAPVLRAVLTLTLFLAARFVYRDGSLLNSLGAAALVLLVADPQNLFDAGFQLTFGAVAAIAGIAVPLLERSAQPCRLALRMPGSLRFDWRLPPRAVQFRLDLRMIAGRVARFAPESLRPRSRAAALWTAAALAVGGIGLAEVLVVSGLMQFALALPMAVCFHRATVMSLPANAIAVPLTGILMPASMAALAVSPLSLHAARIPAGITSLCLRAILASIAALDHLRWADVRVPTPSWQMVLATLIALSAAMVLARRRWWLAAMGVAGVIASGLWLTLGTREPARRVGVLEITNIDVGQAESALVVSPEGKTLLIDAAGSVGPFHGDFDFGEDVVAPYLWWRGFRTLDAIVITHAHSDHYGGMPSIISDFQPRELWVGPNVRTPGFSAVLDQAAAKGVRIVFRAAGQEIPFGGATIRVLAPPQDWKLGKQPRNNDSLVLRVSYGKTSALLTGDAEKKEEHGLLDAGLEKADLLKVAHNGSVTSTTPEFLDALQPKYAAISVGAHNLFHHPRPEILSRLAERHIATYRTDLMGTLTFYLDGRRVTPAPAALAPR